MLAGKAAQEEQGRSAGARPVLKRLYKREADGQEMADIDMAGVLQVTPPGPTVGASLPPLSSHYIPRSSLPETSPSPWEQTRTAL